MKKLVVFYSLSGNTRAVARRIARALRADLLEIRTVKTYPDDYDVLLSLGEKEVKAGYMPQLEPLPIDANKYETILLGTPVWWSSFAPAVKKFLSLIKWKGKKVFPFATHGGDLGHTPSDLRKAMRGAAVAPVFDIRFENGTQLTPMEEIDAWLSTII